MAEWRLKSLVFSRYGDKLAVIGRKSPKKRTHSHLARSLGWFLPNFSMSHTLAETGITGLSESVGYISRSCFCSARHNTGVWRTDRRTDGKKSVNCLKASNTFAMKSICWPYLVVSARNELGLELLNKYDDNDRTDRSKATSWESISSTPSPWGNLGVPFGVDPWWWVRRQGKSYANQPWNYCTRIPTYVPCTTPKRYRRTDGQTERRTNNLSLYCYHPRLLLLQLQQLFAKTVLDRNVWK